MVITLRPGMDDAFGTLRSYTGLGILFLRFHPLWKSPFLSGNDFQDGFATGSRRDGLDKFIIPRLIIYKDDGVMEPAVELFLERRT